MSQRNPDKACKQFTESYRRTIVFLCWTFYSRIDRWYRGHGGQDEDADMARLEDKTMLFTHLELVIGDYCDALKDERWQAMRETIKTD